LGDGVLDVLDPLFLLSKWMMIWSEFELNRCACLGELVVRVEGNVFFTVDDILVVLHVGLFYEGMSTKYYVIV
jgi:hypothetical protein